MFKKILYNSISLIAFTQIANAQSPQHAMPRTLEGLNGLPLSLGSVTAPIINNWTSQFAAQDPANWAAALVSAGTGNAPGDQLTLNDGCATHAVIVITSSGITSNDWYIANRGKCATAPASPIGVLSTTGTGTGAQFNLVYAPVASTYSALYAGNGPGNSYVGGAVPNPANYGQENYFAGGLAGAGFVGNSGGNTATGLGACFGNGQTSYAVNNVCDGNDAGRDLYSPGIVAGVTAIGSTALRDLGSVSSGVTGGINNVTAIGGGSMGYVTAVGGPAYDTAVGGGSCEGASTGSSGATITMGYSTCVGANSGTNFTYINAVLILGANIGNTALNDQDVILIGSGYTPVEPPTITTNDYINFNNVWTATNINTPATSVSTFAGKLSATGGYYLGSTLALNLLSAVSSPIESSETQNSPSSFSIYSGAPISQGWTDTLSATSGNGFYSQMVTETLTQVNGATIHYGMDEHTLHLIGAGTSSGEINLEKMFLQVDSPVINTGELEPLEVLTQNNGVLNAQTNFRLVTYNNTTGTIQAASQITFQWSNSNTTAGSIGSYNAISCSAMTGGGAYPTGFSTCLSNGDPNEEITTVGHVAFRNAGTAPALTSCGTSPSLTTNAADTSGTITEGTSATGCVLTFTVPFPFAAPNCQITSPTGSTFTSYSATTTALTIVNASASGNKYTYSCWATY